MSPFLRAVAAWVLVPGLAACVSPRVESADRILTTAWAPTLGAGAAAADPATEDRPPAAAEAGAWSLDAVLEAVRTANPTVGAAQARLEAARSQREAAVRGLVPELSLGVEYAATDNPGLAFAQLLNQQQLSLGPGFDPTPGWIENWRKQLRVDWPLFVPGRRERIDAAREGERAAELAAEAVENRLLNAGVQAWLGLGAARELEAVALESVGVVERRVAETRRRQELGAALRADVARLEVRLAAARQDAAQAALAVARAESTLNTLMGRPPGAPLALDGEDPSIGAELPTELDALLTLAGEQRRDLAAAASLVRLSGFETEAARAARLPMLDLFGAYYVDGSEPAVETELDSGLVGVGLRLALSAQTGPRIRAAEAEERRTAEELRAQVLEVAREVRDAARALEVAETSEALATAAVGAAEEAYRVLAEAQDAGSATVTDVLEAEDARRDARVRAVAARTGVQLARARLVAATGGVR